VNKIDDKGGIYPVPSLGLILVFGNDYLDAGFYNNLGVYCKLKRLIRFFCFNFYSINCSFYPSLFLFCDIYFDNFGYFCYFSYFGYFLFSIDLVIY
jgi:hypothetical protein